MVPKNQVFVGDILKVKKDELFPADLLFLSSSEAEKRCFIGTSNIDGETNSRICHCLKCTSHLQNEEDISSFSCEITCEEPNGDVNKFSGTLTTKDGIKSSLGVFYFYS